MADWINEELQAAVDAYNDMYRMKAAGTPFVKQRIFKELSDKFGVRDPGGYERRMQNISSVLRDRGQPWLQGFAPLQNVGSNVKERLEPFIVATASARPAGGGTTHERPPYQPQLPAIRDWLINVARAKTVVQYGQVMTLFDLGVRNIRRVMDALGYQSKDLGEPILTALIVGPNGRCSDGIEKEFGIKDDIVERDRLYEYWAENEPVAAPDMSQVVAVKAARFVSVEARPDQAAFRRAVFMAHGGRCAISGCDVVRALDAAHKKGRSWKKGFNRAEDGFLLRKDLHALYDHGLLRIDDSGNVSVDPAIGAHYGEWHGKQLAPAV